MLGSCMKHMGDKLGSRGKHTFFIPNFLAQKAGEYGGMGSGPKFRMKHTTAY